MRRKRWARIGKERERGKNGRRTDRKGEKVTGTGREVKEKRRKGKVKEIRRRKEDMRRGLITQVSLHKEAAGWFRTQFA